MDFPVAENKGTLDFMDEVEADLGWSLEDDENKKKETKKKKSGGFQSLGLSREVFGGIMRMGYKMPTPIQRKTLPITLGGKDIVAMARTGSGKTAAFLIPVLEKLQSHSPIVGARGLILSPTRELAQQTYKFAKSMGRLTSLRFCLLQGGDKLDAQFEALSNNPDLIVATPGRLVHLLVEVPDFGLKRIEVFVVDEADRLFEMGFAMQLKEILEKLPEHRQTMLFSATMPTQLMEFARAGLDDPELIRLDTETKISENLKMAFFCLRSKEKMAALIHLLTSVIPKDDLTIIFAATRHHVDYIRDILHEAAGIESCVAYGSMDMQARKENLDDFRHGKKKVLLVTDVAARGIDIPLLNNVINFEFPSKSKLFIHRVGRAARQGRSGTAFSFITQDELPFVVDLHLFLGRQLQGFSSEEVEAYTMNEMSTDTVHVGRLPQNILDAEIERVDAIVAKSAELEKLASVVKNAHDLYVKTRPEASKRSLKRAKEIGFTPIIHPLFLGDKMVKTYDAQLQAIRSFRPNMTVFEMDALKKGKQTGESLAMIEKRVIHQEIIKKEKQRKLDMVKEMEEEKAAREKAVKEEDLDKTISLSLGTKRKAGELDSDEDDDLLFQNSKPKLSKAQRKKLKKQGISNGSAAVAAVTLKSSEDASDTPKKDYKDPNFFIASAPQGYDYEAENQLAINEKRANDDITANSRLEDALLDITPDDHNEMATKQRSYHWDKRKKRYVKATMEEHIKSKRVKSESGAIINVKNRGEIYDKWQKVTKKKLAAQGANENSDDSGDEESRAPPARGMNDRSLTNVKKISQKQKEYKVANSRAKEEIKDVVRIRKDRKEKEKRREKNGRLPKALRKARGIKDGKPKPRENAKLATSTKGTPGTHRFSRSRVLNHGPKKKMPRNKKVN